MTKDAEGALVRSLFDAWTLFNSCFQEGDEVLVITEEDRVFWGLLVGTTEKGVMLKKRYYPEKVRFYEWDSIRFMCQDGFPVSKLMASPSDRYIEQLDTIDTVAYIRRALVSKECKDCGKLIEDYAGFDAGSGYCAKCKSQRWNKTVYFGDPFRCEGINFDLLANPGNDGPWFWGNTKYLETLVLSSQEGRRALLWDLSTVIHVDGL